MNNIINQYLIKHFFKIIFNTILIFLSLGVILNLFEEIEFFKNLNLPFALPFILSISYVPTLIIELLPFIIFLSSMFYFLHLKSTKDLLSVKVFGYSNLRIILILAFFSFFIGVIALIVVNPITSILIKYYETEKALYSKDVDHLVSINKNGVWIKEIDEYGYKIINANKLEKNVLKDVSIYVFKNNHKLLKRIESTTALIDSNPWQMKDVYLYDVENSNLSFKENYEFTSSNVLEKINSLYKNLNTISFLNLVSNYSKLNKKGYSKKILDEKINRFIALPFFLFLMVVLAAIFTIGTLKDRQNFYYVLISILTCIIVYYFKDLSIALGKTERINLILSIWMPVLAIGLICSIGVIQINEK